MQHIYTYNEMVRLNQVKLGPNYHIHTKKDGTSEAIGMYQILDCWYSGYLNKGCLFWVAEQQRWTLLADFLGEEVGPRIKLPKEIPPPPPQLAEARLPDKPPFLAEIEEILMEIITFPKLEREAEYESWRGTLRDLDNKIKAKLIYDKYYFQINGALVGPIMSIESMRLQDIEYITGMTPCWDYYSQTWRPFLEISQRRTAWFNSEKDLNKDGPFHEGSELPQKYDEIDIHFLTKLEVIPNENV
jgi:hypothetical protein